MGAKEGIKRIEVTKVECVAALKKVISQVERILNDEDCACYASTDEIFGDIERDVHELIHASIESDMNHFGTILLEIATNCVIGNAVIENDKYDY